MHEVISRLGVDIDGAELSGELEGKDQTRPRRRDSPGHRVIGVVDGELGENRERRSCVSVVREAPLHSQLILRHAIFGRRRRRISHAQPCTFVGELNAISDAEVDVDVGNVRNRLAGVKEWHIAEVDFPVSVAWGSGIIRVIRWSALSQGQRRTKKAEETESQKNETKFCQRRSEPVQKMGDSASSVKMGGRGFRRGPKWKRGLLVAENGIATHCRELARFAFSAGELGKTPKGKGDRQFWG